MIDLTKINALIPLFRIARFRDAVAKLEAAVNAGVVPNATFVDAKDTLNRRIEDAAEAFLATGPHAQNHTQSDWWLAAYNADAFVRGAHGLPTTIKRARTVTSLSAYADFMENELLPLANLLKAAKPLIRKRQPGDKTPKQIEATAKRMSMAMTCQCCGRDILANTGTIALHGYERPGHGWQTGSCVGAKHLPFEVSRDRLGIMIENWRERCFNMKQTRAQVSFEKTPIIFSRPDYTKPNGVFGRPTIDTVLTRATFDSLNVDALATALRQSNIRSFDDLKKRDLAERDSTIRNISKAINEQQARFDGWKQTHRRENKEWVPV